MKLKVTRFDCDKNLAQYDNTLLCDGDDAICIMTVEDECGNRVELDLRVRGEVRVFWDGCVYKHYSQFPPELTEYIKNGGDWWGGYYDNGCYADESNWLEVTYTIYNSDGEEIKTGSAGDFFEDMKEMTPKKLQDILLEYAEWALDDNWFKVIEVEI